MFREERRGSASPIFSNEPSSHPRSDLTVALYPKGGHSLQWVVTSICVKAGKSAGLNSGGPLSHPRGLKSLTKRKCAQHRGELEIL